jgi:hypothetical protein
MKKHTAIEMEVFRLLRKTWWSEAQRLRRTWDAVRISLFHRRTTVSFLEEITRGRTSVQTRMANGTQAQ